ncbi:MAG: hypothetical protein M3011_07685 [Actinomycetota bacterium]|nr:hypothetical protein [Actinomycetota bacterium]
MAAARRIWSAPLWAHCLALGLLLATLFPFMSPNGALTSDEGAYALQASALRNGSWVYDYKAAPLDPDGRSFPLVMSSRHGDDFYPYVQHPAYPILLSGASAVAGATVGLHLLALAGTIGTAAAAWLLAGEVDERLRRPAFWLSALSPTLVNGYLLWAHTLAAAVAGLTLVALVRLVRRGPTVRWVVATETGLVAGVMLRSEGLLFAGAVAMAGALVAWRRPVTFDGTRSTSLRRIPIGMLRGVRASVAIVCLAGPAVVAAQLERLWVRQIVGGGYDNLSDRAAGAPWLPGRVAAGWHDLLQGSDAGSSGQALALLALASVVGFGFIALRRWRSDSVRALAIGAAVAVGLTAVQVLRSPADSVSGLFAAWPVALLGLILVRWRREGSVVAVLGVTVGLLAFMVVSTEYPAGGGLEWGGRFFFPVMAPLAVLAVVGIDRRLVAAPVAARFAPTGLLAAVVLTGALSGVVSAARVRADVSDLASAVARHPAPVTVTTVPALPRVAWTTHSSVNWMLTDPAGLPELLAGLHARGITEVAVVTWRPGPGSNATDGGFSTVEEVGERALRAHNLGLYVLRQ